MSSEAEFLADLKRRGYRVEPPSELAQLQQLVEMQENTIAAMRQTLDERQGIVTAHERTIAVLRQHAHESDATIAQLKASFDAIVATGATR